MQPWLWLQATLDAQNAAHLGRVLRPVPEGALDLASNDYLGLSRHPAVLKAARAALEDYGAGARSSRLVSGHSAIFDRLESALAAFKNTEAALVFSSGYAANIGVLSALGDSQTAIFCHKRNHASLIDGCRFAEQNGATLRFWEANAKLERLLGNSRSIRKIVVSDGVFSMDGDLLPLPEILALCEKNGALLLVDDAHGTGTLGASGRGIAEYFGVSSPAIVWLGTLSKALGSAGGFVCGPRVLIRFLIGQARSFLYSTGLPPAAAGAAWGALQTLEDEPLLRFHLDDNRARLARELSALGLDVRPQPSPILPVFFGCAQSALQVSAQLLERGLWCPAIRPPTVARGTSRLRIGVCASWNDADLNRILAGFKNALRP